MTASTFLSVIDDFESYNTGNLNSNDNWNVVNNSATGGSIQVVADGDNKVCKTHISYVQNTNNTNDAFIETALKGITEKTVISVRVKNAKLDTGALNVNLRDNRSSSLNGTTITIATLQNNKIKYLMGMTDLQVSEPITNDTWINLSASIDPTNNCIKVYNNGILKAKLSDFRTVKSAYWADFNLDSFKLRLQTNTLSKTVNSEALSYVDDVKFVSDSSVDTDLICIKPTVYLLNNGIKNNIDYSIRNGDNYIETTVQNTGATNKNAVMVLAYMKKGILNKIVLSSKQVIAPSEIKTIAQDINIQGIDTNDTLKVIMLDSTESIKPIAKLQLYNINLKSKIYQFEIENAFNTYSANNVHPRILASQNDFDRIKTQYYSTDTSGGVANIKTWANLVINSANSIVNANINDSKSSYYIGYALSDGKLLGESRQVLDYITKLGMAYKITGDSKYAEKAWVIMNKAGEPTDSATSTPVAPEEFPDWNPTHYLDVGEMTTAFAIGYDWLYDYLSPDRRSYIERSIVDYGLTNAQKAYTNQTIPGGNFWVNATTNWNIVCNGGMTVGALAVAGKYPELSSFIVQEALKGLKYALPMFAPDGAWEEGPGYAVYALQYLSFMVSSMQKSLGTDYGITSWEGINKIGEFLLQIDGPVGINNFHDVGAAHLDAPQNFWLSDIFKDNALASGRLYKMNTNNISGGVYDLLWYNTDITENGIDLPKDAHFRNCEVICMRGEWGDRNTAWLSAHAGKSNVGHWHNDNGTFVLDSQGERWADDLGADNYSLPGYFVDSTRATYYRTRAEGHNTLVINPNASIGHDMDASTTITNFSSTNDDAKCIMDLSTAFKTQANSVRRGYALAENSQTVTIRDEIDLKIDNSTIYWFMHTQASATISGNSVILTKNGKSMKLEYLTDASSEISIMNAVPLPTSPNPAVQNANTNYRKVAIKLTGSGKVNLTVKITPIISGQTFTQIDTTELNNWLF